MPQTIQGATIKYAKTVIFSSILLFSVAAFADNSFLAPNQVRYDEVMAEWGKENADAATEQAHKDYPGMRTITGEYRLREITVK